MKLLSVNLATPHSAGCTDAEGNITGIDKRPVDGPVAIAAPGPKGVGGSGLAGDTIGDLRHHGGDFQAVYAFAREDLDAWAAELGRELPDGVFGENLTTADVDVNNARIGERWRLGQDVVLEVCSMRVPCGTFAGWLGERGWVRKFTRKAEPGAYLRVIEPGVVQAGDAVKVVSRPDHEVSVSFLFRALTTESGLLPRILVAADALDPEARDRALRRIGKARTGKAPDGSTAPAMRAR